MTPIDRVDCEKMFIYAVLRDNALLFESQLTPDMFTKYTPIFIKIVEMAIKGTVKKSDLVIGANEREMELIESLDGYTTANWRYFHDQIVKAWSMERIRRACKIALEEDLDESVEEIEKALNEVSLKQSNSKTKKLSDLLLPMLEKITDGGHVKGVPFGFNLIDKATMGAKPGQLVIVAARPSQGKSALMSHLIRNMGKVESVGVITIESDENELSLRIMAGESKIDSRILMNGNIDNNYKPKLAVAGKDINEYGQKVFIHDQAGIRLNQLQGVARKMARDGIKVLFVDYLQLIKVPNKESKREEVAEASTALKSLARELKICVVALAQLGRDADDKRPSMGDIQHSSQCEQDADQVWLIYHTKDKDGKINDSRIILEKVRDGATKDVAVDFERTTMNFYEKERQYEQ